MNSDNEHVVFDENNNIRFLKPEVYNQTEELAQECHNFVSNLESLQSNLSTLVNVLQNGADRVERYKLLAIGERNRVATEVETRDSKIRDIKQEINQKKMEMERQQKYIASLRKIELEQKAVIERLTEMNTGI